jgi:FtsH-binding integral membrane protein
MQRNAVAVALMVYLLVAVGPVALKALPLPGTLDRSAGFYGMATVWLIICGCIVSLVGVFWFDRLDGSVIEQFGLVLVSLGFILYAAALARVLPMNQQAWLPLVLCGGFAVAFMVQLWIIYRWRKPLKGMVRGDAK